MTKARKLTGLWMNKTEDGQVYMSGKDKDGNRFSVWKNAYKEADGERAPDYVLFVMDTEGGAG